MQILREWAKRAKTAISTCDVDAFLFETDDVGACLDWCEFDIEQIVRFVADFTQFRHTTRSRYRRFHVQWTRTCLSKRNLQSTSN